VVVEDKAQLQKYYGIIGRCKSIKYFVVYKGEVPNDLPEAMKGKVFPWTAFLESGDK
jgi:hypothetical protein